MQLTFFCPSSRRPVGGIKVIYRLAELCDQLMGASGTARVLHPNRPCLHYDWFDSRPQFSRQFFGPRWAGKLSFSAIGSHFSADRDIVVLPEIWVRKYGLQLAQRNIPFVILVQGGYLLTKGDKSELDFCFSAARLILSVSDNTSQCIEQAFPLAAKKIRRLVLHVDAAQFRKGTAKENLITYMPRKLPEHIKLLKFFMSNHLPSDWKIEPIDGLDEAGVAGVLARSKIFLSMSYLEGLGLPPVEAALAGNWVVGYTGEGGKEYWALPIFHEIAHGDLLQLTRQTLALISQADATHDAVFQEARERLAQKFSLEAHRSSVNAFLDELCLI